MMYELTGLLFLVAAAVAAPAASSTPPAGWGSWGSKNCKQIQYDFPPPSGKIDPRAERIKEAYLASWNQYAKYGFGYDGVGPISNTPDPNPSGWGLDIVDGLDTALVMGLTDVVDRQLQFISTTNFSYSPQLEDEFDVTIRWIGGLLSGYDLITDNKVPNASHYNKDHVKSLLDGARTLADVLKPCFDTPSGLPQFFVNTTTGQTYDTPFPYTDPLTGVVYNYTTNTAEAGTLILEWNRLSDLTGDESYRQLATRSEDHLINPKPAPIYPNLVGSTLDLSTGRFFAYDAGWQSGIDSFYEYLIKSAIYNPNASTAATYKDFWVTAVESTEKHLATHPYDHPELTFITQLNGSGSPMYYQDDYACFAGGNFLLGGAYLDRQDFIELGLAHTDSCHATYNATASGLNPLTFAWYGPDDKLGAGSENYTVNSTFNDANGFFVINGLYTLYPEPIESMFYAWRITGDTKWQDYVWNVFESMQADGDRNGVPMCSLSDVLEPLGGTQLNMLPSYYFAEVLKYMYLVFAPTDLVSLDDFVFNTECHPLRVQSGTCGSQSGGW